ncbi:isoprenylcysteine carboxyl methyltransferase family protein [Aggregatibacter actinomycetemcomitans]|uniref:isoprenylcysteine carboxyl methyltransferase family protein n=1 Tax=Aggregatibacter actinomycetemcomitans TaxID=714 RepID=UPI00023FF77B|nr:isoprenylcysteine carboxyl methyltransferase family protein [Aggregatibacter actinomycetemcomitans]EHK89487.1 ribonuclease T [Aggregatibacter actinomycetemcomitans RhAA1]KNE76592.1 membrane protein [Aggregatibacter actinomycetemcomitans RhAA1]MBN6063689.1 isoprenylcysteine carboxyl methyltransferase family protein [Aggregatibacter actinomycetemcomitans]MBN6078984.1 isoprenylcysteine carboxyl methyltransferase family protein [Aggregatibacter actinomycetemcomitans]MBN6083509.1 isoprenylcystei
MLLINIFFALALLLRFYTLSISIKNEKNLLKKGAIQYGKKNSIALSVVHILFYFSCITEANYNQVIFNKESQIGLMILIFSLIMLFYVIYQLKEIWTVKVYILPNHKINTSFIFRYFRHPNYFLNIIPELIGLSLLCQAKLTAMFILPLYMIILAIRIIQEEKAMKCLFKQNHNI